MSEKRFTYDKPLVAFSKGGIHDNVTGETYEFTRDTVLDLLNKQQATIEQLQKKLSECQGHKLELTPIPISRSITLKEAEDSIRVTKYEELFDDE